jgi:protoheme IX farnesyltransferase
MKAVQAEATVPVAVPALQRRVYADLLALTKPRVTLLVLITTLIGFHLGTTGPTDLGLLLHTLVGTALVASGAAAINQVMEQRTDALMRRTRLRPLPAGRLRSREARAFALALAVVGLAELALGTNLTAGLVALATIASYALVYTLLKQRTSLAVVIGAVPGALPSMIG